VARGKRRERSRTVRLRSERSLPLRSPRSASSVGRDRTQFDPCRMAQSPKATRAAVAPRRERRRDMTACVLLPRGQRADVRADAQNRR
jgi:hypothetical protein